jgi:Vacuolar (H+)-ATPase G subunit
MWADEGQGDRLSRKQELYKKYLVRGSAAKADRLKQAKAEAEKEIKAYKAQREEQYQKRIAEVNV